MTKKEFKELVRVEIYTGSGVKLNALFFEWKTGDVDGKYFGGFKYMVKAYTREATRKQLFDLLYGWVTNGVTAMPHYADYKFAATDLERFKVPLQLR